MNINVENIERPDFSEKCFIGLLTGIYDYDNTLLGERVLFRRVSADSSTEAAAVPAELSTLLRRLQPFDPMDREEFRTVYDAISNNLDGQTLAVRRNRLEMLPPEWRYEAGKPDPTGPDSSVPSTGPTQSGDIEAAG
jgi:hypothetical protein